jgi:hypothetical protein
MGKNTKLKYSYFELDISILAAKLSGGANVATVLA